MKHPNALLSINVAKTSVVASAIVLAMAPSAGAVSISLSPQTTLDQFKTTVTSAIDTSITQLQSSANSLNLGLSVTADQNGVSVSGSGPAGTVSGSTSSSGATGSYTGTNGSTASGSVSSTGASGSASSSSSSASSSVDTSGTNSAFSFDSTDFLQTLLSIPKSLIQKLQQSNQDAITKLDTLKTQVAATTNTTDLQAQAKQYDQEFKDIATANIQATVTKSIADETQVLSQLQTAASALQSQVNQLKDCIQSGSANASGSVSSTSASGSVNASAPGCTNYNVDANSGDNGQSLQDQINEIKSSLETMRSFLSSSIDLVSQLKDGNYSGTITSFSGVSSQMDIVANLSSNVQNDLVNLSAAVNK